jgi:hypothetical protein
MEPIDNIEETIKKKLNAEPDAALHNHVLAQVRRAYRHEEQMTPALGAPVGRRSIMKSPITKLGIAAAIIAAVVLGLFEFIDTGTTSGVVWAKVAQQVETCPGVIFRNMANRSDNEYSMNYLSATKNRKDIYEGGALTVSHYLDFETMTASSVCHAEKFYWRDAPLNEYNAQEHDKLADPKWIVQSILSCEHQKLGEKTIGGVRCEGLKTTDPAVLGEDRPIPAGDIDIRMELWVSVATKYPVLCEGNAAVTVEGQTHNSEWVMDQFQWNVELAPSVFKPNIPDDYEER